jgi:hypothetical protein
MKKIIAIESGGDWTDASCEHIVLLKEVNLDKEKRKHEIWYEKIYLPALKRDANPKYFSFTEWLIEGGLARKTEDDELEIYFET